MKKSFTILFLLMSLLPMTAQTTFPDVSDGTTEHWYYIQMHLEQAKLQLTRTPRKLPVMKLNPDVKDLFSFQYEDFQLEGYDPWDHIKAEVSV